MRFDPTVQQIILERDPFMEVAFTEVSPGLNALIIKQKALLLNSSLEFISDQVHNYKGLEGSQLLENSIMRVIRAKLSHTDPTEEDYQLLLKHGVAITRDNTDYPNQISRLVVFMGDFNTQEGLQYALLDAGLDPTDSYFTE